MPPSGAPDIYMAMAQLEMGEVPSDWRESQDGFATKTELNIVDGKVETVVETVDSVVRETATPGQYQVYVTGNNSMVAENGGETVMQLTPGMFYVNTNVIELSAPNESLRIDGNGANMDNLTVNQNLIAPNIARRYGGKSLIYISSTMSTTNDYDVYPTLQEAFAALNFMLIENNVEIRVAETQYGILHLYGINGGGIITVKGWNGNSEDQVTVNGRLCVNGCNIPIIIRSLLLVYDTQTTVSTEEPVVDISACRYVELFSGRITTSNANQYCIRVMYGSAVRVREIYLYSWSYGRLIYAGNGCRLMCDWLYGGDSTAIYLNANSSFVSWTGSRPNGDYIDDGACLFIPSDLNTLDAQPQIIPPAPVNPTKQYRAELKAILSGTYNSTTGTWETATSSDTNRGNHLYQGRYDSPLFAGCMWFDTSDIPTTANVKNVALTFKRYSGAGGSSPVAVHLYTTPLSGKTGDPRLQAIDRGVLTTSIANGETQTVSTAGLTGAVELLVETGGARGLMFYVEESVSSGRHYSPNYARFDGVGDPVVPTLTITYEA